MLIFMLLPVLGLGGYLLLSRRRFTLQLRPLRAGWLIAAAAVLTFLATDRLLPGDVSQTLVVRVVTVTNLVLVVAFLVLNWTRLGRTARVGLGTAAVGTLLNAIPNMVYGGMPFDIGAARTAGFSAQEIAGAAAGHLASTASPSC